MSDESVYTHPPAIHLVKESPKRPRIPGRSTLRNKSGILNVKPPYLRLPYKILKSKAFLELDPLAQKLYFLMLSKWSTHDPDRPVKMSYKEMRDSTRRKRLDGKYTKPGYTQIRHALTQLHVEGFIIPEHKYKQVTVYWIEQKWFTGEWGHVDW